MAAKYLEIHPAALAELKSAAIWYHERSETAAKEFMNEVDRAVQLVQDSPLRWPPGSYNSRRFVLRHFPFAIIYRDTPSAIQILAVAHGHRHPDYWKGRL